MQTLPNRNTTSSIGSILETVVGSANHSVSTTKQTHWVMFKIDPKLGITQSIITPKKDEIVNALLPTSDEIEAKDRTYRQEKNEHELKKITTRFMGWSYYTRSLLGWIKQNFFLLQR